MTQSPHLCEADVIEGLEPIAREEIKRHTSRDAQIIQPGVLQFTFSGHLRKLFELKTALSVYLVQHFAIPRPKALLGDQHLRALMAQIRTALDLQPNAYRTFMLGAAGSGSSVMTRLKAEIARRTGLGEVDEEGDLLVRVRPSSPTPLPPREGRGGWDVLVRLSSKPLATREWRVCNIEGALQATVAHAMVLLTQPKANDMYLNLCCGSGTLLIERALCRQAKRLLGCDIDPKALECAQTNVGAWRRGDRFGRLYNTNVELHDWDATQMPLPDASVDALTADLPFGNLVGSHQENLDLYPRILQEAARVAKRGAPFVLITAESKLVESLLSRQAHWRIEQVLHVNLGGLQPRIFVLRKVE